MRVFLCLIFLGNFFILGSCSFFFFRKGERASKFEKYEEGETRTLICAEHATILSN